MRAYFLVMGDCVISFFRFHIKQFLMASFGDELLLKSQVCVRAMSRPDCHQLARSSCQITELVCNWILSAA